MRELLAPGGHVVLAAHVHLTRFFRSYFERFYRFVDPPHPHHFHVDEIPGMFSGLGCILAEDIDSLWLDLDERYQREAFARDRSDGWRKMRSLLNPWLHPLVLARLLGRRPVFRKRLDDRPLMARYLFVFR
jgi:hypothetical protein